MPPKSKALRGILHCCLYVIWYSDFQILESVADRKARGESVQTVVIEGLSAVSVDVDSNIWPDVDRQLKREPEGIFQPDLSSNGHHESVVISPVTYMIPSVPGYPIPYISQ